MLLWRGLFWRGGAGAKLLYREMDRMDWRCRAVIDRWDDAALAQLQRWDVGCCWLTVKPSLGTTVLDRPQRETEGEREKREGKRNYRFKPKYSVCGRNILLCALFLDSSTLPSTVNHAGGICRIFDSWQCANQALMGLIVLKMHRCRVAESKN